METLIVANNVLLEIDIEMLFIVTVAQSDRLVCHFLFFIFGHLL